jgi:hypothetical protein
VYFFFFADFVRSPLLICCHCFAHSVVIFDLRMRLTLLNNPSKQLADYSDVQKKVFEEDFNFYRSIFRVESKAYCALKNYVCVVCESIFLIRLILFSPLSISLLPGSIVDTATRL